MERKSITTPEQKQKAVSMVQDASLYLKGQDMPHGKVDSKEHAIEVANHYKKLDQVNYHQIRNQHQPISYKPKNAAYWDAVIREIKKL